ncbi:DUF4412 domain-containing protein [Deferribacter thermophilus]|uniref:DUF4412 domain-containing protein n=1 Tax=Deferribacter thermophilus TaxID=53573 RepID=UPI003C225413
MKIINTIIIIVLFSTLALADVIITAKQRGNLVKTFIKKNLLKNKTTDFEFIFNGNTETFYTVDHKEKKVIITTKDDLEKLKMFSAMFGGNFNRFNQNNDSNQNLTITKLGTKVIASCNTDGYRFITTNSNNDVYFCKDKKILKNINLETTDKFLEFLTINNKQKMLTYNMEKYGIPFYVKDNLKNEVIYEVEKIEFKNLKLSIFDYPKNYQIMKTSEMLNQIPQIPQGLPENIPNIPN